MQNDPEKQKVDAYYEQLRKGSKTFDEKTANALLMQVSMEDQGRIREQNKDKKSMSLMMALIFPWRLFDPAMKPSNGTRMLVILVFFVLLIVVLPMIVLKLVHTGN
jgi:hypothetical protein